MPTSPSQNGDAESKPVERRTSAVSRNKKSRSSLLAIIHNEDTNDGATSPKSPKSPPLKSPKSPSPKSSAPTSPQAAVSPKSSEIKEEYATSASLAVNVEKTTPVELLKEIPVEEKGTTAEVELKITPEVPDESESSPPTTATISVEPQEIEASRSVEESDKPRETTPVVPAGKPAEITVALNGSLVDEQVNIDESINIAEIPAPIVHNRGFEDLNDPDFPPPPPDDSELQKFDGDLGEQPLPLPDDLPPPEPAVMPEPVEIKIPDIKESIKVEEPEPIPEETKMPVEPEPIPARTVTITHVKISTDTSQTPINSKKSAPPPPMKSDKAKQKKAELAKRRSMKEPNNAAVAANIEIRTSERPEVSPPVSPPWERGNQEAAVHLRDKKNNNNGEDEKRASISERAHQIELQLNKEQTSTDRMDLRTPSISSPLSEAGESVLETPVGDFDAELSPRLSASMKTSSFTALDVDTTDGKEQDKREPQYSTPVVKSNSALNGNTPPGMTNSEPGINGTATNEHTDDSGIYSLIGETIEVVLRPTKNDNKKPDYAVPAFDRTSSDLKRVTFQSNKQEIIPTSGSSHRLTVMQEEQIKRTGLSEDDVQQAELFYKGHLTEVMVCKCLATLYYAQGTTSDTINMADWKPEHVGIPVLIYNTGEGKRQRGLTLVFAERGTGFPVWKTLINYLSRWEKVERKFHRCKVDGSHDQLAGMAFQDEESAEEFYAQFQNCISDPDLNVLNNPNFRPKKKKRDKSIKKKIRLPSKTSISMPCQFTHITQLKQSEEGIKALSMVTDNPMMVNSDELDSEGSVRRSDASEEGVRWAL